MANSARLVLPLVRRGRLLWECFNCLLLIVVYSETVLISCDGTEPLVGAPASSSTFNDKRVFQRNLPSLTGDLPFEDISFAEQRETVTKEQPDGCWVVIKMQRKRTTKIYGDVQDVHEHVLPGFQQFLLPCFVQSSRKDKLYQCHFHAKDICREKKILRPINITYSANEKDADWIKAELRKTADLQLNGPGTSLLSNSEIALVMIFYHCQLPTRWDDAGSQCFGLQQNFFSIFANHYPHDVLVGMLPDSQKRDPTTSENLLTGNVNLRWQNMDLTCDSLDFGKMGFVPKSITALGLDAPLIFNTAILSQEKTIQMPQKCKLTPSDTSVPSAPSTSSADTRGSLTVTKLSREGKAIASKDFLESSFKGKPFELTLSRPPELFPYARDQQDSVGIKGPERVVHIRLSTYSRFWKKTMRQRSLLNPGSTITDLECHCGKKPERMVLCAKKVQNKITEAHFVFVSAASQEALVMFANHVLFGDMKEENLTKFRFIIKLRNQKSYRGKSKKTKSGMSQQASTSKPSHLVIAPLKTSLWSSFSAIRFHPMALILRESEKICFGDLILRFNSWQFALKIGTTEAKPYCEDTSHSKVCSIQLLIPLLGESATLDDKKITLPESGKIILTKTDNKLGDLIQGGRISFYCCSSFNQKQLFEGKTEVNASSLTIQLRDDIPMRSTAFFYFS